MYVSQENMLDFVEYGQRNAFEVAHDKYAAVFPATKRFMQLAFHHGAYCAGGFAALIARQTIVPDPNSDTCTAVRLHTNRSQSCLPGDSTPFSSVGKGDIDLFFPSQAHVSGFYANDEVFNLLGQQAWSRTSVLGVAREHFFGTGTEKVQVITRYTAPIKHQLSSFDILNAACAFNHQHMFVPTGWLELERERTLHVHRWNQFTVGRVNKYMRRKGYISLSPKTASEIHDKAICALKEIAELREKGTLSTLSQKDLPKTIQAFGGADPRKVAHRLHPYLPSFTNEQLLELSVLCPQGNYNEAFKMLINRGELQGPRKMSDPSPT